MADNYYKPGDWNAVCWRCGKKRKASELRRHWQGFYVCPEHWEPRHPQDFARGIPEDISVPWEQKETLSAADNAVCSNTGISCITGYAVAGCSIAGYIIFF